MLLPEPEDLDRALGHSSEGSHATCERQPLDPNWAEPRTLFSGVGHLGGVSYKLLNLDSLAAEPISRILSAVSGRTAIPLGHALLRGSSDLPGGCGAPGQHASPAKRKLRQAIPPYLVLLRVGFALPVALLRRRCALTAPFHPYRNLSAPAVYFLWHFPSSDPAYESTGALPDVIRHTALRSSDFPLSRDSDRPAQLPT